MTIGRRITQLERAKHRNAGGLKPGMRILFECSEDGFTLNGSPLPDVEAHALIAQKPSDLIHVRFVDEATKNTP